MRVTIVKLVLTVQIPPLALCHLESCILMWEPLVPQDSTARQAQQFQSLAQQAITAQLHF